MVEHLPERTWELTQGASVQTRDGTEVGRVAEVQGAYFRVDVSLQPDFWLNSAAIQSVSSAGVLLDFDHDELDSRRLTSPPN